MTLAELCFLAVFWSWAASVGLLVVRVRPIRQSAALPPELAARTESVQFAAADGVPLQGWLIRGESGRPWALFCHGFGRNRAQWLPLARSLAENGLNILCFDFRGHGTSRGILSSLGWRERLDVLGALLFLSGRSDVPAVRFAAVGAGMGARAAAWAAAQDERIGVRLNLEPETTLSEDLLPPFWRPAGGAILAGAYTLIFGRHPSAMPKWNPSDSRTIEPGNETAIAAQILAILSADPRLQSAAAPISGSGDVIAGSDAADLAMDLDLSDGVAGQSI